MILTRCKLCVMPTTRPDTEFVDGVCSACLSFEKRKAIDWSHRACRFQEILGGLQANSSGYDCIVASSGGKDSHWQVQKLLDYGVKPLIVTAKTCMLTKIGRANIENLKRYANTVVFEYDEGVRAKLNVLGQELVGDISWPEHVAIFSAPFKVAVDLGIKVIFYGENPQEAYGGPLGTETAEELTRRWITEFGGQLGLRPRDMIGKAGITLPDMTPYMIPELAALSGVQAFFMGSFFPWDSHENWRVAKEMGMVVPDGLVSPANWWPFENLDNAMTGLHDFGCYVKYGYGRVTAQTSVDIRYGIIGRKEAMYLVERFDGVFPLIYMGVPVHEVCERLGVRYQWLVDSFKRFTNHALFDGEGPRERLVLKEFANGRHESDDGGLQPSDAA